MNGACNSTFFFGPASWGPWEGPKGQISLNIIKFQLQSQFQRFLNQTLCVFSQMKEISDRIFIWPSGSCPRTWGYHRGLEVSIFFSEIQPDLVCELLT